MTLNYELGANLKQWRAGDAQNVSLVLTQNCNLMCKYCYETRKNTHNVMSKEIAFDAVKYFLNLPNPAPAIVWELTGGECTLEIELMHAIAKFFKSEARKMGHPWEFAYRFLVSTNGTLYRTPMVQKFVWENKSHVCVAITIDGTKEKHDMQRVFTNGRGSYDIVEDSAKLCMKQFDHIATKVTFSHDDLPFVCDSIVHLWDLGFKQIAANCVFEDVWEPGDPELYESQLTALAEIAIDKDYWKSCRCNLFWVPRDIMARQVCPQGSDDLNWCGTGTMAAVDSKGDIYPCVRFMSHCLNNQPPRPVGNIYNGFDEEALRTFHCLRKSLQCPQQCLECTMVDGCSWCSAHNYDCSKNGTVFERATYVCEIHKARWRANQHYWKLLKDRHGIEPLAGSPDTVDTCII